MLVIVVIVCAWPICDVTVVIAAISFDRRPIRTDRRQIGILSGEFISGINNLAIHYSQHTFNAADGILINREVVIVEYGKISQLTDGQLALDSIFTAEPCAAFGPCIIPPFFLVFSRSFWSIRFIIGCFLLSD